MSLRIPAAAHEQPCPKCGAANHDSAVTVWSANSGPGTYHCECDCCAHSWRPVLARPDRMSLRAAHPLVRGPEPDDHL